MNILFVTKNDGHPWAGPSYSVPRQIKAQTSVDNVFWYNLYGKKEPEYEPLRQWRNEKYYHDLIDYPTGRIADLPAPFNKADIIIVEPFYLFGMDRIVEELMSCKIPYVIVPRSEFTRLAQKRHWYKKIPANILRFYKFAQNACAIQYLTEDEAKQSGNKWNQEFFIIPNGCDLPSKTKTSYQDERVKGIYIGRIETYQKGLDVLVEAIKNVQDKLRKANFTMNIFGPNTDESVKDLTNMINMGKLNDLISITSKTVIGEEKMNLLLGSDVFIMPSRFEGLPMALIEALSYGLPCFVATGTNMRKEIEEADAGWGTETTVEAVSASLLQMIGDINHYEKMGKNAICLASRYSWENIAKMTHDILQTYV